MQLKPKRMMGSILIWMTSLLDYSSWPMNLCVSVSVFVCHGHAIKILNGIQVIENFPEPLFKRRGKGGWKFRGCWEVFNLPLRLIDGCWDSFDSHNLNSVAPMSTFLLKQIFQIYSESNVHYFLLGNWPIWAPGAATCLEAAIFPNSWQTNWSRILITRFRQYKSW